MAQNFVDRAWMTTATTGTGTITLGTAISGPYMTFAQAGIADQDVVHYVIIDGNNFERGYGTYTASGTTLTRNVTASLVAGVAGTSTLSLSGSATVFLSAFGLDLMPRRLILNANYTGANQSTAQKIFNASTNGAVTLAVGTFRFRVYASFTTLAGGPGSLGFALGGTATFTQFWTAYAWSSGSTLATASAPYMTFNTAANTTLYPAASTNYGGFYIDGILRVTVSGTVIPQYSQTNASAAVVQSGSFCEFEPIADSSTGTIIGPNWS